MRDRGDEGAAGVDGESGWFGSAVDEPWGCCFHGKRSLRSEFDCGEEAVAL